MKINSKIFCYNNGPSYKGFTLIELLIVVGLIALFSALTIPFGVDFYREQIVEEQAVNLSNRLKIAQSRAISKKGSGAWGIAFHQPQEGSYTLFKGDYFEAREEEYDEIYNLSSGIMLDGINEVVFMQFTGHPLINPEEAENGSD